MEKNAITDQIKDKCKQLPKEPPSTVDFIEKLKCVLEEAEIEEMLEPNAWRPG